MLLNNFYFLLSRSGDEGHITASIRFDPDHEIFAGHFPSQPIVPGVCMIQIIRELLEHDSGLKLKITTGDNVKFLQIINPQEHPNVNVDIQYQINGDAIEVTAGILLNEITFFKFTGTLQAT